MRRVLAALVAAVAILALAAGPVSAWRGKPKCSIVDVDGVIHTINWVLIPATI
jgi:hypothetical protein